MARKRITISLNGEMPADKAVWEFISGLPRRTRSEIIKEILLDALEKKDDTRGSKATNAGCCERSRRYRPGRDYRKTILKPCVKKTHWMRSMVKTRRAAGRAWLFSSSPSRTRCSTSRRVFICHSIWESFLSSDTC